MSMTQDRPVPAARSAARCFATLLVHAEPELSASNRVEAAAHLARDGDALLIGVGAEMLDAAFSMDPFGGVVLAEWLTAAQQQIDRNIRAAEEAFRRDAAGVRIEWRQANAFPDRALIDASRAADLIVMSPPRQDASSYRSADPAEVVMKSGRPVLIVPNEARRLRAERVVVAWKDTRETRRAIADAMPFLIAAQEVIVTAVCADKDVEAVAFQAGDVAAMLKRQGATVRTEVVTGRDEAVAGELDRVAQAADADLIVMGAYGHSRAAEWVFGGVTRTLLREPHRFILTSH
ncbi:universal stress protein [Phenylobacterium sp. J426]|uniref:universal stress protein n=1 Tax=Phenylobacterium sp. J426 TaxID=2898439 RepID=UPI002150A8EA|nr:universal stress protein [Phenylobacterium sp. J426]MCR5875520.1 universal stress protein [Phenylobacterium sp. J426]